MSGSGCSGNKRKHTPIVSEAQRGMMGAELGRRRAGKTPRMKGMTTEELEAHLHESKGKNLPETSKRPKGSGPFTDSELMSGYKTLWRENE